MYVTSTQVHPFWPVLTPDFQNFLPVVYSTSDPYPIAVCSARYNPDGTPIPEGSKTYKSSATIKHVSLGGPGLDEDIYLSTGSDDFRGYVWRIPSVEELLERRELLGRGEDVSEEVIGECCVACHAQRRGWRRAR